MKILILCSLKNAICAQEIEDILKSKGEIPINPVKVLYALPEEINNSEFAVVLIELVRISDAVFLGNGWNTELVCTIAKNEAVRQEKKIIEK